MDEDLRRAERAVQADSSTENLRRFRAAVVRATGTPPRPGFRDHGDDDEWLCDEAEAVATLGTVLGDRDGHGDRDEENFRLWCLSYDTGGFGRAFALLVARTPWPLSDDDELDELDYDPFGGNPDAVEVARWNALDTIVSQGVYAWTIPGLGVASTSSKAAFDGIGPTVAELLSAVEEELERKHRG